MQHWILRCKHCGKEYTYRTYGNKDGCSQDYCGDCQTAIDYALKAIPVRFEHRAVEFEPSDELKEKLRRIHEKELKRETEQLFPRISKIEPYKGYDSGEEYQCDFIRYYVRWNKANEGEKHYFVEKEYDLLNDCFTDKYWHYEGQDYCKPSMICRPIISMIESDMPAPSGMLYFDHLLAPDRAKEVTEKGREFVQKMLEEFDLKTDFKL